MGEEVDGGMLVRVSIFKMEVVMDVIVLVILFYQVFVNGVFLDFVFLIVNKEKIVVYQVYYCEIGGSW